MKKLFVLSCAALALAACTSEEETVLGGDSSKQISNLKEVSAITRGLGDGQMNVAPTSNEVGNDRSIVYVQSEKKDENGKNLVVEVNENISYNYVNVICNTGSGFFHGENGWAVKNSASGTLDNNRKTYSWFYNEKGEKQSMEPNDQGLLLVGSNCDLSKMNQNGKRAIVNVGDKWFDDAFAFAENFVSEALKTQGTVVNYAGQNPGTTSDLTYTEYSYEGYRVIVVDQTYFQNGAVAGTNDQAKAPWCWGNWNTLANDGNQETIDHNVIIVPTADEITFNGRYMDCHIFAPGKKVNLLNGACPSGLVICDELVTTSEIHGTWTPFEKEEEPCNCDGGDCETNLLIDLGIDSKFIVIADDFAIQNGDKLYMNAAIEGEEHKGVTNGFGEGAYVVVDKGQNVHISVEDICSLYPSYIGKSEDGVPYINEDGELTLVVYLWPGQLDNDKNFTSVFLREGYIIGEENAPVQHAITSEQFKIMVSAYVGRQGSEINENGEFTKEGWSYVKVSIHIKPLEGVSFE